MSKVQKEIASTNPKQLCRIGKDGVMTRNRAANSLSKKVMAGSNQNKAANDKNQKPDDKYTALKRVSTG